MRLSIKHAARSVVLAGAVAAGAFAIPVAADAAVSNCAHWVNGNTGFVACNTTGGSQYRAHVKCAKIDNPTIYYWADGKWVSAGPSSATCNSDSFVAAVQHQTR